VVSFQGSKISIKILKSSRSALTDARMDIEHPPYHPFAPWIGCEILIFSDNKGIIGPLKTHKHPNKMRYKMKIIFRHYILFFMLVHACCFTEAAFAKYYKYINKNGETFYVDDLSQIPGEYADQIKVYKETDDYLSDEEKEVKADREKTELEEEEAALDRELELYEEEEKKQLEQAVREKSNQEIETKVAIIKNQVLVPVVLGYAGFEVETPLILDTGATATAIHREIADQLNIREFKKAKARVASGKIINADIALLDYIRVGPITKAYVHAGIIDHAGKSSYYKGLLGMNFLRGLEYRIDFKNQLIRWKIKPGSGHE
jgi:predicted aspartyl protease